MCTGIEMLMLASVAVGTTSALYQGATAANTAEANQEMQRREGEQEKDAATAQAEKIRRAGRAAAARANASLAGAGVAIGEGTPLRLNEQIYQDSESDAYNTLLTGTRRQRYSEEQGSIIASEGQGAKTGSYLSATSTILGGARKYNNWQASQKKKAG